MSSTGPGVLSPTSNMAENFKIEKNSYFEIHRTPPEEKRRALKAQELAANQEVAILLLTPFTAIPRIAFDRIKLGTSAVRQLVVRNPGTKEIVVSIEKPPSGEKGFALDYLNFRLGGREETTLHIGWTPYKGGGVRENIVVKFGGFRTQVILIGSCIAPEEKKQFRPPPPKPVLRPLGVRNSQKAGAKTTGPQKGSKSTSAPPPTKIVIPANPIVLQTESPPKRVFAEDEDYSEPENRRETFVKERPLPTINDIIQSTPKNEGDFMGPPDTIPLDRRQTYLPRELKPVEEDDKENNPAPRRTAVKFGPVVTNASLGVNSRRATYIKAPDGASWTPQKPAGLDGNGAERKKWSPTRESFGNLTGLRNLNESAASTVFGDVTEDINLSLDQYNLSPEKELSKVSNKAEKKPVHPRLQTIIDSPSINDQQQQPLNLSVKKNNKTEVYQPDVSDISLAEYDLNMTDDRDTGDASLAVNVSGFKFEKRLDDFDADEFDNEGDEENHEDTDIDKALDEEIERLASQRATSACSRNLSTNPDELPKSFTESATSTQETRRISSGTVVRGEPTFEASNPPDCTDISLAVPHLEEQDENTEKPSETPIIPSVVEQNNVISSVTFNEERFEAVKIQEEVVCIEKEIIREEVIEEVIEYEYEIRNGVKVCVGERNMGKTETENICGTPVKHSRMYEKVTYEKNTDEYYEEEYNDDEVDNISKLIQDNMKTRKDEDVPRGAKLSESELDGMLGMLALSQEPHKQDHPKTTNIENNITPPTEAECADLLDVVDNLAGLPGLRGSPKVSNQLHGGAALGVGDHYSFLHKTVTEASFMPPSPDDPRRCSTGIKDKNKECYETVEPSPHIKKSLFQQTNPVVESEFNEIPLSSGGHALPIIVEPGSDICRLSSDTYVAANEVPPLSIIQELEEMSQTKSLRTNNTTTERNTTTDKPQSNSYNQSSGVSQQNKSDRNSMESNHDVTKSRTPAKPSRINARYSSKPIENVAIDESLQLEDKEVAKLTSGLLFVAISPEKQEKRKSSESITRETKKVDIKKGRYSVATSNAGSRLSTANKRVATLPRRSMGVASNPTRSGASSASKPASVTAKPASTRRSIQPSTVSRLNLSKKRNTTAAVAGMSAGYGVGSTRPNPFASRNRYYDERWIEKQEKGFCNWLNFILTPQSLDTGSEETQGALDIAKVWAQCSQGVKVPRAPTREVMSIRAYTVNREMNRLRRAACKLWQSRAVATIIERMELEIEKLRLVIRKDKQINKDIGMKQKILSLLLSYNPLWLRIALETVYGEVLMLNGNSDILGISRFLITRLLSCPDILQEYAHPTVPHSYREGHQEALNKFTLKKFLEIVYLLDQAKENRLIRHNPCLFCPDSKIKSSRDILTTFSKDYLSGEGDIIKHLSYLDYNVSHKQTVLDEFDYAVTSISADLRCGIRLTKVAELLTIGSADLSSQLRVPTVSRLQKVHNTEIALKQLKQANSTIPDNISAKDIVDGHREKTLSLLWSIIFGFQLNEILDEDKLRCEILHLRKSLRLRVRLGDKVAVKGAKFIEELKSRSPTTSSSGGLLDSYNVGLLKEWAQLVTAHYHVEIENWTVSWCDGRGLCYLMHHYQPALMAAQDILQETTITSMSCSAALDDSLDFSYGNQNLDKAEYNNLLENEKKNFKVLLTKVRELGGVPILINTGDMSNTIPDEKVTVTFIGYLAARLLDISREIQAARTIQLAWRKYYASILEERMKTEISAAKVIQRAVRKYLKRRRQERYKNAALCIQTYFRGYMARKQANQLRFAKKYAALTSATISIQSAWKGYVARKRFIQLKKSTLLCQSLTRMYIQRIKYTRLRQATITIQQQFRARQAGKADRKAFEDIKDACVVIQRQWRCRQARKDLNEAKSAAVAIQTAFRAWKARKEYLQLKKNTIIIQQKFRANQLTRITRAEFLLKKRAAVKIQSWLRCVVARASFDNIRSQVIKLQAVSRGYLVRQELKRKTDAAICLQRAWRSRQLTRQAVQEFQSYKEAVVKVQSRFRMLLCRRKFLDTKKKIILIQSLVRMVRSRKSFLRTRNAALKIQQRWLATLQANQLRKHYLSMKNSAIIIQKWARMKSQLNKYYELKSSVIAIQSRFRGNLARQEYNKKISAINVIQFRWRAVLMARQKQAEFASTKLKIIKMQSFVRMVIQRNKYLTLRRLVIGLQAHARGFTVRKELERKAEAAKKIQLFWRSLLAARKTKLQYTETKKAVLKLQSWTRMAIQRKEYLKDRNQIIKCQAVVKGFLVRQQLRKKNDAVKIIQSQWKAFILMRRASAEYNKLKQSTITIQSFYRMIHCRREYLKEKEQITKTQAVVKGFLVRKDLTNKHRAATKIQSHWRAYRAKKQARCEFITLHRNIIKLQSWIRMILARKAHLTHRNQIITCQAVARGFLTRTELKRKISAAKVIQTQWRAYINMKKARQQYLNTKASVIRIQSWSRMIIARRNYIKNRKQIILVQSEIRGFLAREMLIKNKNAAKKIQTFFRAYLQAKQERKEYLDLREKTILIQSHIRGYIERKKYGAIKKSVIKLQALVRGTNQRRMVHQKRKAIITIQSYWRNEQLMRSCRQEYLAKRSAAVKIQAFWRMYKERQVFNLAKNSCIKIQSCVRRYQAVKKYTQIYSSTLQIQRWYRNIRTSQETRANYLEERTKLIRVQSVVRGFLARRSYKQHRQAAVVLQANMKMYLQRKQYVAIKNAASIIQRRYRSKVETDRIRMDFVQKRQAAVAIQAGVRGWIAKSEYNKQRTSAILIQSLVRMRIERTRFGMLRGSVISCQRMVRAKSQMRTDRNMFLAKKQAAIKIQSFWRMYEHRQSYITLIQTIIFLQARIRAHLAETKYKEYRKSALTIQKYFRNYLEMKRERARYLEIQEAVVKIQRSYRGYVCRKNYQADVKNIVLCQTQVRVFIAKRKLKALKEESNERSAATKIQSWYRQILAARMLQQLKQQSKEEIAATKVQSWYRQILAARMLQQLKQERKEEIAATKIQTIFRGFMQRRNYAKLRRAVAITQLRWRANVMTKDVRKEYLQKREAALKIQSFWRMFTQRKLYLKDCSNITTCQSYIRKYLARKRFVSLKNAALVVQQRYRANRMKEASRAQFLQLRLTTVKLQSMVRMKTQRTKFLQQREAAIKIQAIFRSYIAKKNYMKLKQVTITMQQRRRAIVLGRKMRQEHVVKRRAAVTIQRIWRGSVCRWEYQRKMDATLTLQAYARGWLARRYVKRKRAALTVIQQTLRSYRAMVKSRQEFVAKRQSICNLQRICRGYLARQNHKKVKEDAAYREELRQEYLRQQEIIRNKASVVIVRAVRMYIVKKRIMKRIKSAVVIQKYWRGYKSRQQLREKWQELTSKLTEIRQRLEEATASAEPEQRLGVRTANAIEYLFDIRDVAQLIHAVKTLDMATRLSEDCCIALSTNCGVQPVLEDNSEGWAKNPLAELLNLVNRCNRSIPHMEVVSISLDILINISRVPSTRRQVASIPGLVTSLLQLMVVFRAAGANIFSKICALLQILSTYTDDKKVRTELSSVTNLKKLNDHKTLITNKQKMLEQSKLRRSTTPQQLPAVSSAQTKKRKGSSSVATSHPWAVDPNPRFHQDPITAISALIHELTKQ